MAKDVSRDGKNNLLENYFAFEGGEGSGKTSNLMKLCMFLRKKGYKVVSTREPGGTSVGSDIRTILLEKGTYRHPPTNITEALLMTADRAQHANIVVKPKLEDGYIVLSDRSLYSLLTYQGYGRGLSLDMLKELTRIGVGDIQPGHIFLFDVLPEVGLKRRNKTEELNRLDQVADKGFYERVRSGYLEMAKEEPNKWTIIDANQDPEKVWSELIYKFTNLLIENGLYRR